MNQSTDVLNQFEVDVLEGLSGKNKELSSKYFYDAIGDALFQRIMGLDEYYLTRKEREIFDLQKDDILAQMDNGEQFRIIELGAGDGSKTKILLKYFLEKGANFTYTPVDISANALELLEVNMKAYVPGLRMESYHGDYFDALADISSQPEKDVVFFLGSTIGNFPQADAVGFLKKLNENIKIGDQLFVGFDLKKDPEVILRAYNDAEGVTREFNLNLLDRMNRELGANFNRTKFIHYPYYNPQSGECRSYLISKEAQSIRMGQRSIQFRAWEAILMEISRKYEPEEVNQMALNCGYTPSCHFLDGQRWFMDTLWVKE